MIGGITRAASGGRKMLADISIRKAKPREKSFKLFDGGGLSKVTIQDNDP